MPSHHVEIWARHSWPDEGEIGIIVALEIGVQLGIKGENEKFVVFTRMNLFLEEM